MWLAATSFWLVKAYAEKLTLNPLPLPFYEFIPLDLVMVRREYARPPPR